MRWRFWSGRRDRLALSLLGVLVLAAGLSFMSLLSDSVTGTVTRTYEQTWRAPYDILVHMPLAGAPNIPDITEPNVLTTLPAGISREQLDQVRAIPDVTLAAPLSVVGDVMVGPRFEFPADNVTVMKDPNEPKLEDLEPGVYRLQSTVSAPQAPGSEHVTFSWTFGVTNRQGGPPDWMPQGLLVVGRELTATFFGNTPALVVGVDPAAEAQLAGLNSSVTTGRYFDASDSAFAVTEGQEPDTYQQYEMPVLINEHGFDGLVFSATVEKLDRDLKPEAVVYRRDFMGVQLAEAVKEEQKAKFLPPAYPLFGQAGPLTYGGAQAPFPARWPLALALKPAPVVSYSAGWGKPTVGFTGDLGGAFRSWTPAAQPHSPDYKTLKLDVVGFFDASKLSVVKDPDSQLPLTTYRPAEAQQVLDPDGRPVNPPNRIVGGMAPAGFLSSPPIILTTLDAALEVNGDDAINAIQVKVSGSEHFTPEDVAHVQQVADEIQKRTGLVAEVTMGSSPVNVLVRVPASGSQPDLGWLQEQWIHKNAAVTTVQQAEFGYSVFIAMVLAVAVLYTVATGLAGVTARRRELGVAASLGWPAASLRSPAVLEQLFFSLVAGLLAAVAAAYGKAAPWTVAGTFAVGLLVYLPAVLASGYVAALVSPGDALRWGDTAPGKRVLPGTGVTSLAASSLMGRPGRTALTIVAIALPTALMLGLTFISQHLQGVLYTTVAGQYTALKVGPVQYVIGLVGLAIAGITAFDLVRQNAIDHRNERALLSALGWPRGWVARTMIMEGTLLGLTAGLIGDLLGLVALAVLYGPAVTAAWETALAVWLLPLGLGLATGSLSALAEMRSWNRAALAGVGSGQVIRWGRGATVITVAVLVLGLLAAGYPVMRQVSGRVRRRAASAAMAAAQQSIQAIHAAVNRQSTALNGLDTDAFLAALDPAAEAAPYRMEQRHWLEDAAVWKRDHPHGMLSRTVQQVSLLGANTADVRIWQVADADDPADPNSKQTQSLDTVWIKTADGMWVEHGLQHQVLTEGAVTVWYSGNVSVADAQESAGNAQQAMNALDKTLGWKVDAPVVLEMADNPNQTRAAIGPHLATKQGIPPWVEYGEPLRIAENGPLTLNGAYYHLAYKAIMDQSHNHAAEWLREALGRYAVHRLADVPLDSAVEELQNTGPVSLDELPRFKGFLDLSRTDLRRASATAELFVAFLEQRYGPNVTQEVLAELAKQPVDLRMTGPATYGERSQASVSAIEKVTGRSWQQLNGDYQAWFRQLP